MKPANPSLPTHLIYRSAPWPVRLSCCRFYTDAGMSVRVYDLTHTHTHTHTYTRVHVHAQPSQNTHTHTHTHRERESILSVASNRKKKKEREKRKGKKETLSKVDKVLFHISDDKYILAILVFHARETQAIVSGNWKRRARFSR